MPFAALVPTAAGARARKPAMPLAIYAEPPGPGMAAYVDGAPDWAIYACTSSYDDEVIRQIYSCRRYALRIGMFQFEPRHVFVDRGSLGSSPDVREALNTLMAGARIGRIRTVVVDGLDRLSEEPEQLQRVLRMLKCCGVEVHDAGGTTDTSFTAFLTGGQRDRRSETAEADRRKAAKRGFHVGWSSFGHRAAREPGRLRVHEREATVVRRVLDMFNQGKPASDIASILNAEGILSPDGRPGRSPTVRAASRVCSETPAMPAFPFTAAALRIWTSERSGSASAGPRAGSSCAYPNGRSHPDRFTRV